jgi:hypothetical protein
MDMEEAQNIADELKQLLETGIWHCQEAVYKLLPHRGRWNIDAVVQSQLICCVHWERIVVEHQGAQRHDWKWTCCIPNQPLDSISRIPGLKEWIMFQCQITRIEQLMALDEWMDKNGAVHFYEISDRAGEAASCMRLDRVRQGRFLRRIKHAMRIADAERRNGEPRLHSAPALTGQATLRQGIAEVALQHARSVTRGFAYSHQDHSH